jgi:hypothetical protein
MRRPCEICCAQSKEGESPEPSARYVLVEARVIALCGAHYKTVTQAKAKTLAEVNALFAESDGQRSLLSRRAPVDRRVFPPRPEGRRRSDGRRDVDSYNEN